MAHCFSRLKNEKALHCLLSGFGIGLSWGVIDVILEGTHFFNVIEAECPKPLQESVYV
jgi:hypothetical protein